MTSAHPPARPAPVNPDHRDQILAQIGEGWPEFQSALRWVVEDIEAWVLTGRFLAREVALAEQAGMVFPRGLVEAHTALRGRLAGVWP